MSRLTAKPPRILHTLPGRVRVHVPRLAYATRTEIEQVLAPLRLVQGVRAVSANSATGNVLVIHDPQVVDAPRLLAVLAAGRSPVVARIAGAGAAAELVRSAPVRSRQSRDRARVGHVPPVRAASPAREPAVAVPGPAPRQSPRRIEPLGVLRSVLTALPGLPIVRRWVAGLLGPVPAALLPLVPAAIAVVRAIISAPTNGPTGWAAAGLDAVLLVADVGGALRVA